MKERFHVRVLAGRPATRHALADATGDQARPKQRAQKLAAAIAVKDQPSRWPAAAERGVDDGARQPRVSERSEPPREDSTRALIQDDRQVPPPAGDRQIREVAHPDLIGLLRLCPTHVIRGSRKLDAIKAKMFSDSSADWPRTRQKPSTTS